MFQKIKKPLIILAILLLGFVGYNTLIKKPATENLTLTQVSNVASPDQSILPLLLKIKDINFDSTIFNDPVFKSLEDYGLSITAEETGRGNPFAPSFSVSASTSSITGPSFELQKPSANPTRNPVSGSSSTNQ